MTARPNHILRRLVLALFAATGSHGAWADIALSDSVQLSGFGTLGAVQANGKSDGFVRDRQYKGAKDGVSLGVDSNFGLQLTGRATDWLSATVQGLYAQREEKTARAELEWGFVKVEPVDGFALRGGRFSLPMFLASDSRNVGYANNWQRPPDEVYGLALLNRLDGGDISYRLPAWGTSLTFTGLAGRSEFFLAGGYPVKVNDVLGLNVLWDVDWLQVRFGQVKAKVPDFANDAYTFTGVGATVDVINIVAQAEYVTRKSATFPAIVNAKGWYVLGGYRFGKVLPYATLARTTPENSPILTSGKQKSFGAGVRWDAFTSAALKFQIQRSDAQGTQGISFDTPLFKVPSPPAPNDFTYIRTPAQRPITAISLAIDFVF